MFTGIVTDLGEVRSVKPRADNLTRVTIYTRYPRAELLDGASIACNGVCMTLVEAGEEDARSWFGVDAAAETLARTTVGRWHHGRKVNLERPLKLGDELGGHLVLGHVDGLATVVERAELTDMVNFVLRTPPELGRFIAPKGSVTLDGVSLTVNTVKADTFSVLIIPHTLAVTAFGDLRVGDDVNLEVDTMARYVARLMGAR
jgi:riboflavin synthase